MADPMDILQLFPVRKTREQKQAFRDWIRVYAEQLDYPVCVESGRFGCRNVVIGDPEAAKYLLTAHYDTPARLLFPNASAPCSRLHRILMMLRMSLLMYLLGFAVGIAAGSLARDTAAAFWLIFGAVWLAVFAVLLLTLLGPANKSNVNDNSSGVITLLQILNTLPENQRHKVCFVLFDLEEAGLIGSGSYRRRHKLATENQLILNLDCVGDGDQMLLIPTKKLKKDRKKLTALYRACGYFGEKSVTVCEAKYASFASDQKSFPYGVGIGAFHTHKRFGPYLTRIHTPKDTVLDISNVNILRAALTTFICCDEVY